jgi:hypothetical protein
VLSEAVQKATGESVEVAFAGQGYTGDDAEADAASYGIDLQVVSLKKAKRGFELFANAAGWWSGRTAGWRDSVAWPATTSGSVRHSRCYIM